MEEDEFEFEEESNNVPMDIVATCKAIEEAWKTIPDQALGYALEQMFNGYDLKQCPPEEIVELLNDFIVTNR